MADSIQPRRHPGRRGLLAHVETAGRIPFLGHVRCHIERSAQRLKPGDDRERRHPSRLKGLQAKRMRNGTWREVFLISAKEIRGSVDNRLMSFVAVLQVIGSLQLVSSCAVVVYAIAAWRRKGPERQTPTPFDSVPEALKLLSDLQRPSRPVSRWTPQSPLARAEAELARAKAEVAREAERLRPGPSTAAPLASAINERAERLAPIVSARS